MTAEQRNPEVRTAEQTQAAKRRAVLVFSVLGLLAVGTVLLMAYLRGKPVIEISSEEFYYERYPELKVSSTGPWPRKPSVRAVADLD